mmetsp:Transcript_46588/g.91995  ORF Transcript_46588/g.91995 Transcript_46588/m.91995 type:complete len:120 (+) Transcript_46588:206-565(+)
MQDGEARQHGGVPLDVVVVLFDVTGWFIVGRGEIYFFLRCVCAFKKRKAKESVGCMGSRRRPGEASQRRDEESYLRMCVSRFFRIVDAYLSSLSMLLLCFVSSGLFAGHSYSVFFCLIL